MKTLKWGLLYTAAFLAAFVGSALLKMNSDPTHGKYNTRWDETVGKVYTDLPYGEGAANKFDLYVPSDKSQDAYGLAVYLHAGGFTSGDKAGDAEMLKWLCSKGYVAAGINYTLFTEENPDASVYSQSEEIKAAMPSVVAAAEKLGYKLDRMAIAGGSAGGCLALIYAYRDADTSPLPVKMVFEAVGPGSFHVEDWGIFGLDQSPEAAAGLFSVMSGQALTPEDITSGAYLDAVKPISADRWVTKDTVPSVLCYGAHDKMQPFVPNNYTQIVKTGGELEAKYLAMGASQVEHMEVSTEEEWGNINVYYPKELTESAKSYPVVVMVNGTGVYSSKYPALFKHLASWGFIVIGNEDPSTCSGSSADTTLAWLLNENENPDSRFYQKVDEEHIGISGHSQGGVGVFNAINEQPHGSLYTCAVSLSPTQLDLAEALNMHYEPDKTNIPVFLLAATESDVITPDGAKQLYDAVKNDKAVALRNGMDHGKMLYSADGYVTAWFMWYLKGDTEAAKVFTGDAPELLRNQLYQEQQIDISCIN